MAEPESNQLRMTVEEANKTPEVPKAFIPITNSEDSAFVHSMNRHVHGKDAIPEEILDLLALFEEELMRQVKEQPVTLKGSESFQPMAVARAYTRYMGGERIE